MRPKGRDHMPKISECERNRNHEATGFYRSRVTNADSYLCEACAEKLSPRPSLLFAVMTRLEAEHS